MYERTNIISKVTTVLIDKNLEAIRLSVIIFIRGNKKCYYQSNACNNIFFASILLHYEKEWFTSRFALKIAIV